ncbi:hypothetical protein [Clostridium estertheticum]|uniref:hypothetical protein n=1 Tax=Clostridium estertheticum TaxID=238834 RepID=UPI001CF3D2AC|nr:hypothetical protein [Clostridium estertheticum]MCB2361985.1 hypothetical protein [Clostridium estertheticum]
MEGQTYFGSHFFTKLHILFCIQRTDEISCVEDEADKTAGEWIIPSFEYNEFIRKIGYVNIDSALI